MNITMVHDLDTGFLAATLKPVFEHLGHTCTVVQTLITQIEGENPDHIDIHTGALKDEFHYQAVQKVFEETDFFIIRSISDTALRLLQVGRYVDNTNGIYKVHGSELRELNHPYSLQWWRTLRQPLLVCGPRDPSLIHKYRHSTITHIERPINFDIIPRKRAEQPPFALHTPTNVERKGTRQLMNHWDIRKGTKYNIPLDILHSRPRVEILRRKAQCSFYIDRIGDYEHGPYGMNSVEAWLLNIPVYSQYSKLDLVMCPELSFLVRYVEDHFVQHNIQHYEEDRQQLRRANEYARSTHNPHIIAQQYIHLGESLEQ